MSECTHTHRLKQGCWGGKRGGTKQRYHLEAEARECTHCWCWNWGRGLLGWNGERGWGLELGKRLGSKGSSKENRRSWKLWISLVPPNEEPRLVGASGELGGEVLLVLVEELNWNFTSNKQNTDRDRVCPGTLTKGQRNRGLYTSKLRPSTNQKRAPVWFIQSAKSKTQFSQSQSRIPGCQLGCPFSANQQWDHF